MARIDYAQLIDEAIERVAELAAKKEAIDIEISKLRQFMYATLHLLPEGFLVSLDNALKMCS